MNSSLDRDAPPGLRMTDLPETGGIGGIADRLPIYITYTDIDGHVRYANPALLRAVGKPGFRSGGHLRELLGEDIYARTEPQMRRVMQGETVRFVDTVAGAAASRHLELTFVPDLDPQGNVRGYFGIGYDLTDRIRQANLVASREQQLHSILNSMAEGLVMLDREGRFVETNPAAEQLLSLTREQILAPDSQGLRWEAVDEDGAPLRRDEMPVSRTLHSGVPSRESIIGIRIGDGPIRWLSVNAEPLYNGADPEPSGAVGTFSDVTALRASVERIRTLMSRVEDVRAEERRELGLLLHEGIAQDLFSIRLALGNLRRDLRGAQAEAVEAISGIADRCLADTRQLAHRLRPTGPDNLPIGEAIAQHARYFAGVSGLQIRVHHDGCPAVADESLRLLLFRAAQEALTNIARHAQAACVDLSLLQIDGMVELRVTDDGIGVQPGALEKSGSLGLLGMAERARAAGGSLKIEGGPDGGTSLILRLPLG